jgi:hypothetical protein
MSRFERWLRERPEAATAAGDRDRPTDRLGASEPKDGRQWSDWFWLASLAAVAVLAFELTADPAIGTVILCLKLGLDDLVTARWHFRNDPDLGRARTLFWFHLARASWWVGLSAIVLAIGVVYFALFFQGRILKVRPTAERLLLEAVFAILFGILVTAMACGCAIRYRVKAWIDSRPGSLRRGGWPPVLTAGNSVRTVIFLAVFFFASIGSVGLMMALRRLDRTLAFAIMMTAVWISIALSFRFINALQARVVAEHPGDCWPHLAPPPVQSDDEADPDDFGEADDET